MSLSSVNFPEIVLLEERSGPPKLNSGSVDTGDCVRLFDSDRDHGNVEIHGHRLRYGSSQSLDGMVG